jgi:23S rRNA pseudouridine2605 synthase
MMRINKYLARSGVASRRTADLMVTEGRVSVNGEIVDTPGFMVDETADEVCVDGKIVAPTESFLYIVLNKPPGFITSLRDPHHRRTVRDLLTGVGARVYPVGRLDLDTEGVLLFTNDGELAHRLTHPRYGIKKVYYAQVKGKVGAEELAQFSRGIKLPDGNIGHAVVTLEKIESGQSHLIIEMTEGRKREVKHLCSAVGHPVDSLRRINFAGIGCDDLQIGQWRRLTAKETNSLRRKVGL